MPFTCSAVLFDLDGVLVDSNPIVERHWKRWAERHGVVYERIEAIHHGRPTGEIIRHVAPHLDAAAEALVQETAGADDVDGLVAFDGAHRLVRALPPERWAVATSGTRRTASFRLAHLGFPEAPVLVTADDVRRGKPAPDPYLLAAERLGVAPEGCVVIEDAPAGIASAKAAGMRVVAVASSKPPEALAAADVVVRQLADLAFQVDGDEVIVSWNGEAA